MPLKPGKRPTKIHELIIFNFLSGHFIIFEVFSHNLGNVFFLILAKIKKTAIIREVETLKSQTFMFEKELRQLV